MICIDAFQLDWIFCWKSANRHAYTNDLLIKSITNYVYIKNVVCNTKSGWMVGCIRLFLFFHFLFVCIKCLISFFFWYVAHDDDDDDAENAIATYCCCSCNGTHFMFTLKICQFQYCKQKKKKREVGIQYFNLYFGIIKKCNK